MRKNNFGILDKIYAIHLILFRFSDIIIVVIIMTVNEILIEKGMTKYRLAKLSGIPNATLSELCSGKTNIKKCTADTVYKIAKVLEVPMESLLEESKKESVRNEYEKSYEYGLPGYLQHDLDAFKEGLENNSSLMDCLWCELYGSINSALIDDGAITEEHAEYLRNKYLRR